MKKLDILAAIAVVMAWGSNYIAVQYSLSELPSFLSLALRMLITGLLLLPFQPRLKINFKDLYIISIIGGVLYLSLLYYGLYLGLNTSLAIIIMQLNIPISFIIARIVLKEHFTRNSIIGIIMAFIGTIVVVGAPHISGNILAFIIVLSSTFFCAVFNIKVRQFKSVPPLAIVCWTSLISAPHLFLISYVMEGNPIPIILNSSHISWGATLYSILFASILCQGLWIYLLQKYPIHKVMPYNLLVPFAGVSLSVVYLGDAPCWHIIIGGIITICGIAVSQARAIPFLKNKRL